MKLSCTNIMVPGNSLEEKARKLKQWGYDGIAIFQEYKDWNENRLKEIKELGPKTGITICEFVFIGPLYGHLMDKNLIIRQKAREMYKHAIEVCNRLGAVTEMEYDCGAQDPLPLFEPYKKMSPEDEIDFINLIKEFSEVTNGGDSKILIESINRYETKYLTLLSDCKEILERANQPNTGILADFFHLSIEESNIAESIRSVKGLIKHVHLGDSNRLLPGKGHTDWDSCLRALVDAEFNGYMNLECAIIENPDIDLLKTADYLHKILNRI